MNRIDTNEWKEFSVFDFFENKVISKKLSKKALDTSGNIPVYSSKTMNNGIEGYTKIEPEFIINDKNPIYVIFGDHTKAMNIATESFCVMDNVKVLKPKVNNIKIIQFICTVWKKQIPDLGYSRHWGIASKIFIKLPVDSEGKLDYKYMETFMKNIEYKSKIKLLNLSSI